MALKALRRDVYKRQLEDQRLIGEAKDELKKRVGEAGYVAPIPKDVRPMACLLYTSYIYLILPVNFNAAAV